MIRQSEKNKIVTCLSPKSLATAIQTGQYFRAGELNTVICSVADVGTITGNETAVFLIMKATDGIGTGALTTTSLTKTITAAVSPQRLNILCTVVTNGKYFILNGNTYTAAGAYSLANKEFSSLAELVTLINLVDTTLYAVAIDGTHLGVEARDPGTVDLTATGIAGWEAAKLIPMTLNAQAIIEFKQSDLGVVAGTTTPYTHFAVKCTTDATIVCSAVAEIENNDLTQPVDQKCAAYLI